MAETRYSGVIEQELSALLAAYKKIEAERNAILSAIAARGVSAPAGTQLAAIPGKIGEIPKKIDTSALTAEAGTILAGYTALVNDKVITGNIPARTSDNLTVSGAKVSVPAGHYATAASKSVDIATQATPVIEISDGGLITAEAEQVAGYVNKGSKSATKQLPVKSAKVYTPGVNNQVIDALQWLTGAQTIKGDTNLVPGKIVKGNSIFGVAGSAIEGATIATGTLASGAVTYPGNSITIPCSFVPALLVMMLDESFTNFSFGNSIALYIQKDTTYYGYYIDTSDRGIYKSGTVDRLTTSGGTVIINAPSIPMGTEKVDSFATGAWRWFAVI